jgi:hypothetical protein
MASPLQFHLSLSLAMLTAEKSFDFIPPTMAGAGPQKLLAEHSFEFDIPSLNYSPSTVNPVDAKFQRPDNPRVLETLPAKTPSAEPKPVAQSASIHIPTAAPVIDTKHAVHFASLSSLSSELLEVANGGQSSWKIPKPDGEAGRPGRGGYNLEQVLDKWPAGLFEQVKVSKLQINFHRLTAYVMHKGQCS